MPLPKGEKPTGMNDENLPVLQKVLDDIRDKTPAFRFTDTQPTTDTVGQDELVVYDDGSTRRVYFKSGKGTLLYYKTWIDDPVSGDPTEQG